MLCHRPSGFATDHRALPQTIGLWHRPSGFATDHWVLAQTIGLWHRPSGFATDHWALAQTIRLCHRPSGFGTDHRALAQTIGLCHRSSDFSVTTVPWGPKIPGIHRYTILHSELRTAFQNTFYFRIVSCLRCSKNPVASGENILRILLIWPSAGINDFSPYQEVS